MRHLHSYKSFLFEFNLDISSVIDKEISVLISKLSENPDVQVVDEGYVEIKTPYPISPNSGDRESIVGMTFSPDLLRYRGSNGKDQLVPWIRCSIELEGQKFPSTLRDLLNHLVELLKSAGYPPFKDEDALHQHWRDSAHKGWTEYSCFVNPDYPQGHWENHAI
jgi:hypothetical protein